MQERKQGRKFSYSVRRMEKYIDAKSFAEEFVDVPKFLAACEKCPVNGQNWACPPYSFDAAKLWARYNTVRLIGVKIILPEALKGKPLTDPCVSEFINQLYLREKSKLMKYLLRLEKKYPGSLGITADLCRVCKSCARLEGRPCRHPNKMRYMIEGLGCNVEALSEKLFGTKILWEKDKLPEYYVVFYALLMK